MSPYRSPQLPRYRLHRSTGQAVATFDGHDHYLGRHGSPESRAKYQRLIREFVNAGFRMPASDEREGYAVAKLCDDFLTYCERVYRCRDGSSTGTVENVRLALRHLFEFAADLDAAQFGPRALVGLRDGLIERGLARPTVNDRIQIVRRAFKWAAEQEFVPASVHHGLQAVSGLRRGRSAAREPQPVRPAPDADIQAALPFMPTPVRDMVKLQLLTGARPGEITTIRACDIDRTLPTWVYLPAEHKNSWRGQDRQIYLGPQARQIVAGCMQPGAATEYLFSPRDAERSRHERERAARKTPLWPSHARAQARKRSSAQRASFGDHYDVDTYRQAIHRACVKAGVPPWSPNRLRHNAATQLRREHGLDVAKAVLGHRLVETTQIYAEIDRKRAMETIERVG
jgi:integrase